VAWVGEARAALQGTADLIAWKLHHAPVLSADESGLRSQAASVPSRAPTISASSAPADSLRKQGHSILNVLCRAFIGDPIMPAA
jgi:hypothetical protein